MPKQVYDKIALTLKIVQFFNIKCYNNWCLFYVRQTPQNSVYSIVDIYRIQDLLVLVINEFFFLYLPTLHIPKQQNQGGRLFESSWMRKNIPTTFNLWLNTKNYFYGFVRYFSVMARYLRFRFRFLLIGSKNQV